MTPEESLRGVRRLGLDSAPVIYFIERNATFHSRCVPFFTAIDSGTIRAATSALSLPEVLTHPLRDGDTVRETAFRDLLLLTQGISTVPLSVIIAERAARLRADYNLRTPDAIQVATAILEGCEAFLTNDERLKRITEIRMIVVGELEG